MTGGSRRIGKVVALALAEAGADVAISYRTRSAEARAVVRSIEDLGRRSLALRADFAEPEQGRRIVDRAARHFGRLDILVNNVGEWAVESVESMSLRAWRRVIDTTLTATFVCSKAAIPHMRRRRWGRIVNLGAAGAYRAHGAAKMSAFYAGKAGIVAFSKALAREVGRFGINVNVVSPGIIEDPERSPDISARRRDRETAVGRAGTGADVAAVVLFLASDEASFVTGDVIGVTGGWLL